MIKKRFSVMLVIMMLCMLLNISYATENGVNKKVVSIVYDDSGSMQMGNNFCYSNYALQILISTLGKDDELNIVKTSNYAINNEIDLSTKETKQKNINIIRGYAHNGGTDFNSINTAKAWLINKSTIYKDTADYWFIVITDGEFAYMPEDLEQYFLSTNESFNNLNYEFVLLSIGNYAGEQFSNAVRASANSNVIEASDNTSIYDSLMKISNMINGGASEKIVTIEKNSDKKIRLYSKYPLKKMMILMQNTTNNVIKVTNSNSSLKIENYNSSYPTANLGASLTHVTHNSKEYLDIGYYEIEFSENVDMNKITFLCEAFVGCKISIVDENDKELNNAQMKFLTSNKVIKVKCELYNIADNSKVILDSSSGIYVQLINDKNRYNMAYDDKKSAYYSEITLIGENNNIYAIAEADGLFRIKSNVIFVDTVAGQANIDKYDSEMMKVEIPYSSSKDYEVVDKFIFSFDETDSSYNLVEKFELKLINLPNGVKFAYNGKQYGDNESVPMVKEFGKKYEMDLLSNREYKETEDVTITLKIIALESGSTIYWSGNGVDEAYIVLTPKLYPIKILEENVKSEVDIQKEKVVLSVVRTTDGTNVLIINGHVNIEDIKKINTNSKASSGFPYNVKKDNENNVLTIEFKPNIFAILKGKKVNVELDIILNNEKENASYSKEYTLINVDILAILMPYIIATVGLIILIGYIAKGKFNKKSQITITENGERVSYALKPTLITKLLPYIPHKTKISMIEFTATKNSGLVYSAKNLDVVKIDGETLEEYKESHQLNIEKIVMKKDLSSIIINAFESEQKYEYLTKEIDAGGSVTEDEDYYTSDNSFDSSYTDDNQY